MDNPEKFNPEEAAKYLGMSMRTLMILARAGKVKGGRLGTGSGKGTPWFFLKKHLDQYLENAVQENFQHITGEYPSVRKPRRRPCPPPSLSLLPSKSSA